MVSPLTLASFRGGEVRLSRNHGTPERVTDSASLRDSEGANHPSSRVHASAWLRNLGSSQGRTESTMRRGPKRVAVHAHQTPHRHPRSADLRGAAVEEAPMHRPRVALTATTMEGTAEEPSRKPQLAVTFTCRTRVSRGIVAVRRHQSQETPTPMDKLRARGKKFEGKRPCLGRDALEASAATDSTTRQMKTLKFTLLACMWGELIILLTRAAEPLGMLTRQLWRSRPGSSPGTLTQPVSRRSGTAE